MNAKGYRHQFLNPDALNGPANYWFWQRIPTKDEIDCQLREMVEAGYRVFYIQPRLAFPLDLYLSDAYLEAYRHAVASAHTLGLKAGIYDDYNWNSGHGGGLTVRGHDEFREQQMFWVSTAISSRAFSLEISEIRTLMGDSLGGQQGRWTYEGGKPVWGDWQIVRALAYPKDYTLGDAHALTTLDLTACTVTPVGDDGCTIRVALPDDALLDMNLTVFVAGRCCTSRHINYLDRAATRRFIEVGYEPYKRAVGDYFGSTIFCMFMDHPHAGFYKWKQIHGNVINSLMYHPSLENIFQREHGYPVEIAWLSFLLPENGLTAKYRGDFFATYGQTARECFLGQISDWAHTNGLAFAGHELFSFLGIWGFYGGYHVVDQRTDFGGDIFGIGRYKDISTVDAYNSNPQISAKVGDSVARADGKHGCMLEQYYFCTDRAFPGAIGHWNLTFDEMRTQALRHTFFGVSQFIFHGFYLADDVGGNELLASSRYDFAPGINFEPWFVQHHLFAREIARLSAFLYNAEPIREIALLYPLSTFWVEGASGLFGEHSGVWHQALLEHGAGFDIVDENRLTFDPSRPGRIQCGPNSYRVLVLPGVTVLRDTQLAHAIARFAASGGKVWLSGAIPSATVERGHDDAMTREFTSLLRDSQRVVFYEDIEALRAALPALLEAATSGLPRVVTPDGAAGQVWSWVGRTQDGYSTALFNESDSAQRVVIQTGLANVTVERWQPGAGEVSPWSWKQISGGAAQILVDLSPREVVCFRFAVTREAGTAPHLIDSPLRVIEASAAGKTCHLTLLAEQTGVYPVQLSAHGLRLVEHDPRFVFLPEAGQSSLAVRVPAPPPCVPLDGDWTLSIPDLLAVRQPANVRLGWEAQGFADYSGAAVYETIFDLAGAVDAWAEWDWRLEFAQIATSAQVWLNGKKVAALPWPPYQCVIPAGLLRAGRNNLRVEVTNTGGNKYYADSPYRVPKAPSGMIGAPLLRPVKVVRMSLEA